MRKLWSAFCLLVLLDERTRTRTFLHWLFLHSERAVALREGRKRTFLLREEASEIITKDGDAINYVRAQLKGNQWKTALVCSHCSSATLDLSSRQLNFRLPLEKAFLSIYIYIIGAVPLTFHTLATRSDFNFNFCSILLLLLWPSMHRRTTIFYRQPQQQKQTFSRLGRMNLQLVLIKNVGWSESSSSPTSSACVGLEENRWCATCDDCASQCENAKWKVNLICEIYIFHWLGWLYLFIYTEISSAMQRSMCLHEPQP